MRFLCCCLLMLYAPSAFSFLSIPSIFGDHMVLQQQSNVPIWGWGKPGESITLKCSWAPDTIYQTSVGNQSNWQFMVQTPEAGGPYEMTLMGYDTLHIQDILIGEVWLGSGQSNMEWAPAWGIHQAEAEIATANYPSIRFFQVDVHAAHSPQQFLKGEWVVCSPSTMKSFSALLYFFGRELHQTLTVPVGLIQSAWGGSPAEIWIPESHIAQDRILSQNAKRLNDMSWSPKEPGKAYNSMIHPLIPFQIKGALWYQGETNVGNPEPYARLLATLIDSWRDAWGYEFPFYIAQIAPYSEYGTNNVRGAIVRDQQRRVVKQVPHTGLVLTADIATLDDIHPPNKQDVGKRLADMALARQYGKDAQLSRPVLSSLTKSGAHVSVTYEVTGTLSYQPNAHNGFYLSGADGVWHQAEVQVKGNTFLLTHQQIPHPVAVRLDFANDAVPSVSDDKGRAASCFWEELEE